MCRMRRSGLAEMHFWFRCYRNPYATVEERIEAFLTPDGRVRLLAQLASQMRMQQLFRRHKFVDFPIGVAFAATNHRGE
jgi:hypothetical protein